MKNVTISEAQPTLTDPRQDTTNYIREIVERSSIPFERLEGNFQQNQEPGEALYDTLMGTWAKTLSPDGGTERLDRFFDFYKLNDQDVRQMLAPAKLKDTAELPAWTNILAELNDASFEWEGTGLLDPAEPIAFEQVAVPFVKIFQKHMKRKAATAWDALTGKAQRQVKRFIMQRVVRSMGHCLFEDFEAFLTEQLGEGGLSAKEATLADDHYYRQFVQQLQQDNLRVFFLKYPVLARIVTNQTKQFIDTFVKFTSRLSKDKQAIRKQLKLSAKLGKVDQVKLGISDPHKGGEGVVILTFESGDKVVYKPRDLSLNLAYNKLCEWVNGHLAPQLKTLNILHRPNYGWIEYAPQKSCEDENAVCRYYERAGILLGITYFLESTDFHAENVIASGEHPILVDDETLLNPQVIVPTSKDTDAETKEQIFLNQRSVLRTTLLPMSNKMSNIKNDAMSGFGSTKDIGQEGWKMSVLDKNLDSMRVHRESYTHKITTNLPRLDGEIKRLPAYATSFEKGFTALYELLVEKRSFLLGDSSPLRHFERLPVRFIFRTTFVYAAILRMLLKADYLRDGMATGLKIELLARAFILGEKPPKFWQVLRYERKAMLNRDIPYFEINSNDDDLLLDGDCVVGSYIEESCLSSVRKKLGQLDATDLNKQMDVIRKSINGAYL